MAWVRNASNQVLVFSVGEEEFRFSPGDEKEVTNEQLASEEFERALGYFVVTPDPAPQANDIQEIDTQLEPEIANETVNGDKKASKRK